MIPPISASLKKDKIEMPSFWLLHSIGWMAVLIFLLVFYYYLVDNPKSYPIYPTIVKVAAAFLLTAGFRYLFHKIKIVFHSFFSLTMRILLFATGITVIWVMITSTFNYALVYGEPFRWIVEANAFFFIYRFLLDWVIMFAWHESYFILKLWYEWQVQKERTGQANMLFQNAQLQMLRYQLNPHFLFNSLNSIRSLIRENKPQAKTLITELSEFLRYSLTAKDAQFVPLTEEIDALRHYLSIEKKRFEHKLEYSFEIEPGAEDFPVLGFLLHPIVENAIKYGMKTSSIPLRLIISARVEDISLFLTVKNSGTWIKRGEGEPANDSGTGTGLENVRLRLDNAFPAGYEMNIAEEAGYVCISIMIKNGRALL